jgi:hypothetical protein
MRGRARVTNRVGSWNDHAGVMTPSTTPARVAWMPDSSMASQTMAPTTMYGASERMSTRFMTWVATRPRTATASHPAARSPV